MKSIPLAALAALLLSPAVLADRFYLGSSVAAEKMAEGSSPDVLHGVVIDETDRSYTLRVVGGEVVVPKSMVYKIEKDDLSVADILAEEKKMAQGGESTGGGSLRSESSPAETPMVLVEAEEHEGDHHPSVHGHGHFVEGRHHAPVFDPVIGAVLHDHHHCHDLALTILRLEYLYEATGDRRIIKLVRRLRRAR